MPTQEEMLFDMICQSPAWKWFPNNAEILKLTDFLLNHGVILPGVCPSCKGSGVVNGSHYHRAGVDISHGDYLKLQTQTTLCRECNGTGWIKKSGRE